MVTLDTPVVAAEGDAPAREYLQPVLRLKAQPLAFGAEHRAAHLRTGVLQGEIQVSRGRARDVAQLALDEHQRERVFQQAARQGVELAGGENFVGGGGKHGRMVGWDM